MDVRVRVVSKRDRDPTPRDFFSRADGSHTRYDLARRRKLRYDVIDEYRRDEPFYRVSLGPGRAAKQSLKRLSIPGLRKAHLHVDLLHEPWTYDGERVLLTYLDRPPLVYALRSKEAHPLPLLAQRYRVALCAPESPLVFLAAEGSRKNAFFIDLDAPRKPSRRFSVGSEAEVFWLGDGRHLAVLDTGPKNHRLAIYRPARLRPIAYTTLDPSVLLPFNEARYRTLKRDHYTLVMKGMRTVGEELWRWPFAYFDRRKNRLYLGTYRPTGKPFTYEGVESTRVRRRFVELTIHIDD